ncbi:MAG: VOC family protein [Proteobacteria bacterium]|nr:VOC family protein [Pseudomonadota bacterium]
MSEVTSYAPGTPSYIDLATTDQDAARTFYTKLFGWEAEDMPIDDKGNSYTMFRKNGKDVAALYTMDPQMSAQGVPPYWATYITVADVDASAEAVKAAGGRVLAEPFDVFTAGRMAAVVDPQGAAFNMWQPRDSIGAYLVNEPGALMWNELQVHDTAASETFYGEVFGWEAESAEMPTGTYTSFKLGEAYVGGMVQIQPEWGDSPSAWLVYIAVDDCDRAIDTATSNGAKVIMPPMEVPEIGTFALLQDPQGAVFYVMQPSS